MSSNFASTASGTSTFKRWSLILIWLIISAVAVISCLVHMSSARVDNEYVPMGNDSFYHARRILDTVRDPAAFYEFDTHIHAPEGSLLTWPWGYDYLMAQAVRLSLATGLTSDATKTLLWIPVLAVPFAIGLLILLARRVGLSHWPIVLAGLCMAVAPTTRLLFGFGVIDHHFVEMIFVLGTLVAGLLWFETPTAKTSIVLGAVFGAALAIHNGLFILQLPFLVTLGIRWLQRETPPRKAALALALSLLVSASLVMAPSLPMRLGRFEFVTLSWFHAYIVACTSVFVLLLAWLKPTRNNMLALAALAVALLIPLAHAIRHAESFLSGNLGILDGIMEMQSPVRMALAGRFGEVTFFYSFLIWLAPVAFVICVVRGWQERRQPRLLFWVASVFGLAMLSTQLRMHYFGSFALFLPWLILLQELTKPELRRTTFLLTTLTLVLAFSPQLRYTFIMPAPVGGDDSLPAIHPMLLKLRAICAKDPGIVLADENIGHFIRYYTDCPVVANNFLITPQHFAKADEERALFRGPAEEIPRKAPYVKYVMVRAGRIVRGADGGYGYVFFGSNNEIPKGARKLLLAQTPPKHFELLDRIDLPLTRESKETMVYAKLFRMTPDEAVAQSSSTDKVNE